MRLRFSTIRCRRWMACILVVLLTAICIETAMTRPPSADAVERWKSEGTLDHKLTMWQDFLKREGLHMSTWSTDQLERVARDAGLDDQDPNDVDTMKLCVLLVDFPDHQMQWHGAQATAATFDSVLFGDGQDGRPLNPTGSMTDYYLEVSYSQLFVTGECYGPYRVSQPYSYYVYNDNGLSRSHELAAEVASLADNDVQYDEYALGGVLHGLTVIHAGPGAETGATGIWSHKGSLQGVELDGVTIASYTMNPEEQLGGGLSPIGVFSHEFGHVLGWPDWYDVSYTPGSAGLGRWCLMAAGSYNGGSERPAHPNGWAKVLRGWLAPTEILQNIDQAEIPPLSTTPSLYILSQAPGEPPIYAPERFLVENRQPYGFDEDLPGHGLLIYHQDFDQPNNTNPFQYQLGIVQADGDWALNFEGSRGDAGDPYPGTSDNRELHAFSDPNTHLHTGDTSQIGVWEVSDSDSLMYADLDIAFSRPWLVFTGSDSLVFNEQIGDGDGFMEQGETIAFNCRVQNLMRSAGSASATMSADAPTIQFSNNGVGTDGALTTSAEAQLVEPIVFSIPESFVSRRVVFTIAFDIDSTLSGEGDYYFEMQIEQQVGTPEVLIVDDDIGANNEEPLEEALSRLGIGFAVMEVPDNEPESSPDSLDLMPFYAVFWLTGQSTGNPVTTGQIGIGDRPAISGYLNNGGSLCVSSTNTARILDFYAPSFLSDTLHVALSDSAVGLPIAVTGVTGNAVTDGVSFEVSPSAPSFSPDAITATSGGQTALNGVFAPGVMGVTYSGAYKTVFMSCPIEYLSPTPSFGTDYASVDTLVARILDFFSVSDTSQANPLVMAINLDGEVGTNVVSHTPEFSWVYYDSSGLPQDSFEIAVGTDTSWTHAEMWNPAPFASSDTSVAYGGSDLIDGTDYYGRIRVHNSLTWSPWTPFQFHMNSLPTIPVTLSPLNDTVVATDLPTLWLANSTDFEGDVLTYNFYGIRDTSTGWKDAAPIEGYGIPEGEDSTSYTVSAPLVDNSHYWWQARAYDGFEYSDWTELFAGSFWVNANPQAPTAPQCMTPPEPD
ncbi:M6 family metalloprotease domain-containing protein, partial [candidate division GN15 bacterium]|nr:M6 family metalloprotease domain-containing protein [candidate division GN15 bacterium]